MTRSVRSAQCPNCGALITAIDNIANPHFPTTLSTTVCAQGSKPISSSTAIASAWAILQSQSQEKNNGNI